MLTCFTILIAGVIASGHFCKERGFPQLVRELAKNIVPLTRRLWQTTKVYVIYVINPWDSSYTGPLGRTA